MSSKIVSRSFETRVILFIFVFFVLGFFFGWRLSDSSLSDAQIEFEKAQLDLKSFSQAIEFEDNLGDFSCENNMISTLRENLFYNAVRLDELEKQNLIDSNYYDLLKKKYNTNQVLFYTYYKNYFLECENSSNIVLFFFNSSSDSLASLQGDELDKLVSENDVIIIPMDYGYTESLNYFYNFYDISELPFLVLNYNKTFQGSTDYEEIKFYLK